MKLKISLAVLISLGLALYIYYTPYIAVHNMKQAAENGQASKLSNYVDFPALKENIKGTFNAYIAKEMVNKSEGSGLEALGLAFATAFIGPMVDALITPESLALMMEGQKPLSTTKSSDKQSTPDETDTSMSYDGFNSFVVNVKKKSNSEEPVGFIFSRNGIIGWKLTALKLPNLKNTMSPPPSPIATNDVPISMPDIQSEMQENLVWKYEDINDKFDGRKQYVKSKIESSSSTNAQMIFRKSESGLEAFIVTGDGFICSHDNQLNAAVIFDDAKPINLNFTTAQSNDAVFFTNPTEFAEKLAEAKEVFIRIDDTCGTRTDIKIASADFKNTYSKFN